jgi:hypothetical protein
MWIVFASIAALIVVTVAAAVVIESRRQRKRFIRSLMPDKREQLRGFEAVRGWGSWRIFKRVPERYQRALAGGAIRSRISRTPSLVP